MHTHRGTRFTSRDASFFDPPRGLIQGGGVPCSHRAIVITTREVHSTSTEIARERIEIHCARSAGHEGPHESEGFSWEDRGSELTHVLRHEKD